MSRISASILQITACCIQGTSSKLLVVINRIYSYYPMFYSAGCYVFLSVMEDLHYTCFGAQLNLMITGPVNGYLQLLLQRWFTDYSTFSYPPCFEPGAWLIYMQANRKFGAPSRMTTSVPYGNDDGEGGIDRMMFSSSIRLPCLYWYTSPGPFYAATARWGIWARNGIISILSRLTT